MSITRWFKFTEDSASLGTDSSGNQENLENYGVTSVVDATYGKVAYFDGASGFTLFRKKNPFGDIPTSMVYGNSRTVSFWVKVSSASVGNPTIIKWGRDTSSNTTFSQYEMSWVASNRSILMDYDGNGTSGGTSTTASNKFYGNMWYHVALVHNSSGDVTQVYIDGDPDISESKHLSTSDLYDLYIGCRGPGGKTTGLAEIDQATDWMTGYMIDMRFYDNALDATAVGALFSDGPEVYVPSITIETRSINIPVTVIAQAGAIAYQITYEGNMGEVTAFSGSTDLSYNIAGLEPETQYTIKLYTDTGTGYELTEQTVTTTLPNAAANYDITDFRENGVTDLTSLDATTLANMSSVIPDLLTTGDVVSVTVGVNTDLTTSFVDLGGQTNIVGNDGVLLPFEGSRGAGQTINLTLSDTTTVPITHDEVLNTISLEEVTYSAGDSFVLDGNAIEIFDYYGLTVLSVGPIPPITVEPRSINIPVVIAEVPGAIGYKVAYVGPDGVEVTSTSGGTDLDQNITGLVSNTKYTIKLYADTGSGYVLTEELTATTLSNVAANYDVADLVKDGVIDLSSLPDATISNIAEVMNDLFNTGDVVNVSVQSNARVNTSFIKLGEVLSIEELRGILLPFEQTSGTGQKVIVRLSDGSTDVDVYYDDIYNTITVNGITYSPGDSFILDGQKVTVVEY